GTSLTPQSVNKLLTGTACKQDIRRFLQVVADHFSLTVDDLTGRKRDKRTTLARHIAIYLIRNEHDCSLTEIGRELGGRNHATILHGHDKIAAELKTNPAISNHVAEIREKLTARKTVHTRNRRQSVQKPR
ncbi:MAG: helix-turn-helix domain-containing protein, partial [Dehalococcoidia bacterium]